MMFTSLRLHPHRGSRTAGFTLIEIMVAITIFALLSAVSYRGLDAILKASAHVEQETRKWSEITLAFVNIQQSLVVAVDHPIRARDGLIGAAFIGSASLRNEDEALFAFTRTGFSGHRGALSDLQRIGYRVRGSKLEQLIWPVLDQAPRTEPYAVELLAGVTSLLVRYVAPDSSRNATWPLAGKEAALPAALEITLSLKTGEQITRLFALP